MKPRALIVDDERVECEMFADADRGVFEPHWELQPIQVLRFVETPPVAAVVTDLNMPGLSGLAVVAVNQGTPSQRQVELSADLELAMPGA